MAFYLLRGCSRREPAQADAATRNGPYPVKKAFGALRRARQTRIYRIVIHLILSERSGDDFKSFSGVGIAPAPWYTDNSVILPFDWNGFSTQRRCGS